MSDDNDVANYLLENHNLAVVAGSGFGMSPYVRISYAASDATLDLALDALEAACNELLKESVL